MKKTAEKSGFSGIGFILAAAGSAVGLGNLWSFPYKTSQNGGAAFVFVYVFNVIILGAVVMIAETYLGRRAQANPVSAYKKANRNLGWIGLLSVIVPMLITCYYIVIGGYTVKFTMNSFSDNSQALAAFAGNTGEGILYSAVFLILAVAVVTAGIKNGIEKASKVLMPVMFIILVGVVIYCLCLGSGVSAGLDYYLNPDFAELGLKGVLAAMSQAFFSMSIGVGVMISYGSYTGKNVHIGRAAVWIAFFDTLVALLAGLAIFPAIYHYQAETGIELQNSGIVLLFYSMPVIFETLGAAGKILSFFFFGMVAIAALTSVISMLEVMTQFLIQRWSITRKKAIKAVGAVAYAVSVPIGISLGYSISGREGMTVAGRNLLDLFDLAVSSVFIPVCALGACIALGWCAFKWKNAKEALSCGALRDKLREDGLELGRFGKLFALMIKYVAPPIIIFIDVIGIIDIVFPSVEGQRTFSANGLAIVAVTCAFVGAAVAFYFLRLKDRDTGTNADEANNGRK